MTLSINYEITIFLLNKKLNLTDILIRMISKMNSPSEYLSDVKNTIPSNFI